MLTNIEKLKTVKNILSVALKLLSLSKIVNASDLQCDIRTKMGLLQKTNQNVCPEINL